MDGILAPHGLVGGFCRRRKRHEHNLSGIRADFLDRRGALRAPGRGVPRRSKKSARASESLCLRRFFFFHSLAILATSLLEPSWGSLGSLFLAILEASRGPLRFVFGALMPRLGALGGCLGGLAKPPGVFLGRLGALLGCPGHSGGPLGPSWGPLGPPWVVLGQFWGPEVFFSALDRTETLRSQTCQQFSRNHIFLNSGRKKVRTGCQIDTSQQNPSLGGHTLPS